jgi:hypothetical protein
MSGTMMARIGSIFDDDAVDLPRFAGRLTAAT